MSILSEIQSSAVSSATPLAELLRRCMILATRLDHAPFAQWVDHELNGFPRGTEELPDYRKFRDLPARGNFSGGFGSYLPNQVIATECIDKEDRDGLFGVNLHEPVAEYEALLDRTSRRGDAGILKSPWPSSAVIKYADRIWEMHSCTEAWMLISPAGLSAMLDTIRNRILQFSLEIEKSDPKAGEGDSARTAVPADLVDRAFVVNILGGAHTFNAPVVDASISVAGLDWPLLRRELVQLGIPGDEIDKLGEAIELDRRELENGASGPAVEGWLARTSRKIESGSIDVAANAGGGVLAGVVLKALGLA